MAGPRGEIGFFEEHASYAVVLFILEVQPGTDILEQGGNTIDSLNSVR